MKFGFLDVLVDKVLVWLLQNDVLYPHSTGIELKLRLTSLLAFSLVTEGPVVVQVIRVQIFDHQIIRQAVQIAYFRRTHSLKLVVFLLPEKSEHTGLPFLLPQLFELQVCDFVRECHQEFEFRYDLVLVFIAQVYREVELFQMFEVDIGH